MTTTARTGDRKGILAKYRDKLLASIRSGKTVDEAMLEETLGDAESEEVAAGMPAITINNHHAAPAGDKDMAKEDDDKKTEDTIKKMVSDALDAAMKPVLDALDARLNGRGRDKEDDDDKKDKEKEKAEDEEILGNLEFEAPPGTNDRARKARDSAFLVDSFQQTMAYAEILAPGIRVPTFDRAHDPKSSLDTICTLRRTALDHAYTVDVAVRQVVDSLAPGQSYKTMDCRALRPVFVGAAEFKKAANNRTQDAGGGVNFQAHGNGVGGAKKTIADVNKRNREHYATKATR